MKNFTKVVLVLNPADAPMVDSDFHRWLSAGDKPSSKQMVTIPLYLASLDYEAGTDVIDSKAIRILGFIHTNWWMIRIKARPVSYPVGHHSLIDAGD